MDEMEQRVWQRVLAQPEQVKGEDLYPVILSAREQAGAYRYLMEKVTGGNRELLHKLHANQERTVDCLKGIRLLQGNPVKEKPMQTMKELTEKMMKKCYYRACRAVEEYTSRSVCSEYGEVFRKLADRERENCVMIAEVMGRLKNK